MEIKIAEDAFDSIGKKSTKTMEEYVEELKVRMEEDEFDGLFTSHQIIDNCSFVDFLFIGTYKGKEVVWNACITTARGDYFDKIDCESLDKSYEKFPNPPDYDFMDCFVPCDDGSGNSLFVDQHPELSDKRREFNSKRTIEELDKKELKMKPWKVKLDKSYEYGIGLHIRMNIEGINISDVKEFIEQFQAHGLDAFADDKYDKTKICLNSEELGVELSDDNNYIRWSKFNAKDSVATIFTAADFGLEED